MFKEKTTKKRLPASDGAKEKTTLDARHQQMIQQLQQGMQIKQSMEEQKKDYLVHLDYWKGVIKDLYRENETFSPEYEVAWTSNLFYSHRIRELTNQQKKLLDESKEIDYYVNTGNILFDYYTLIENQEPMVPTMEAPAPSHPKHMKGKKKFISPNQKSILEAFKIGLSQPQPPAPSELTDEDEDEFKSCCSEIEEPKDKVTLVDEYMLVVDPSHMKSLNHHQLGECQKCTIPLTCLLQEGIMICDRCGYQELLLVEQNRPIYRQSNKEASHQSYKRINHFNEWISQIQGKESTDIPEEIFEKIVQEIKKEQIQDTRKLSYHKMREILKKLKFNKYYEHIYYIIYRLNGISPPNFSPELEEKLRNMFKEIQGPFLKHCPKHRKNFMSYSYVLFKFCQLLDKDEYLKHFSLLKSREKLHIQDQIWKKICEEVQWEFIQCI